MPADGVLEPVIAAPPTAPQRQAGVALLTTASQTQSPRRTVSAMVASTSAMLEVSTVPQSRIREPGEPLLLVYKPSLAAPDDPVVISMPIRLIVPLTAMGW